MKQRSQKPSCVVSIRLSPGQRGDLERRAGGRQVGVYLREILFPANDNAPLPRRTRQPSKDIVALAKALAQLGQLATDFREQCRAAELAGLPGDEGAHVANEDIERQLADIKSLLMKGLGIRER